MSELEQRHLSDQTLWIKDQYPEPLCWLLIELAERNKEHWLEGPRYRQRTIGAEKVRRYGLTSNQIEWADRIARIIEDAETRGDSV